eukprot:m.321196 g.321196  ORF g.321196 m.321196 type:complete len:158 (+) comp15996_c1_seq3:2112-2585(+)
MNSQRESWQGWKLSLILSVMCLGLTTGLSNAVRGWMEIWKVAASHVTSIFWPTQHQRTILWHVTSISGSERWVLDLEARARLKHLTHLLWLYSSKQPNQGDARTPPLPDIWLNPRACAPWYGSCVCCWRCTSPTPPTAPQLSKTHATTRLDTRKASS